MFSSYNFQAVCMINVHFCVRRDASEILGTFELPCNPPYISP
jgi:hypothetical protein